VRIVLVAVGRLRPPFVDDVAHYLKLLGRYARLETIDVRDETDAAKRVPEDAFVCLLDIGGDELDSHELADFLESRRASGRNLCFVIGGPFGAPPLPRVDRRLSFGPITLPHLLARVVLLEQLYRAHKILAGEPYHH
jgi:23S rRNA (pseudouridine1915-N3)-methyltransferase